MSLLDKIEELQEKPEPYRRKVLFWTMLVSAIIIVLIWVLTLRASLSSRNEQKAKEAFNENYAPFAVVGETMKEAWASAKSTFGGIKEQVRGSQE